MLASLMYDQSFIYAMHLIIADICHALAVFISDNRACPTDSDVIRNI